MKKALKKHSNDNVATVLENVEENETVQILSENNGILDEVIAVNPIPLGNKIALCTIEDNTDVIKCAYVIGKSTKEILKGELVHVHNVRSQRINFPVSITKEIIKQMSIKED